MNSLMPGHAHSIGVVQRNDDPRVLFPKLLVEASPGHPRLFGHSRDLIRGKDLCLLWSDSGKLFADGCIKLDLVWLKLRAVVECGVLLVDSLATNLREEFPQGWTSVHMPPAFWSLLGELDDRHSRGHFHSGLFPSTSNAMAGDGLGLGELCFDLPADVTNNSRAEEVRVVHLWCTTSLDHLD